MRFSRPVVSLATALTLFLETAGMALAAGEAPAAVSAQPTPAPVATAIVELNGGQGLALQSLSSATGQWEFVCFAPCEQAVPLDRDYRIGGDVKPTAPFRLQAKPGERVVLTAEVAETKRSGQTAGIVVTSVGGGTAIIGLAVVVYGIFYCPGNASYLGDNGSLCDPHNEDAKIELAGAIVAGIGVAAALVGGAMLVSQSLRANPEARVSQTLASLFLAPRPGIDVGDVRTPVWNDVHAEAIGVPRAMTTPLFTQRF